MEHWFYTSDTVPDGLGFSQFGRLHLCWLAAFAIFAALICLLYHRAGERSRQRLRRSMAIALIADELFKIAVLVIGGNYNVSYLPLHLCSINIILIAIHAWHPTRLLDNFLYAFCLPAAVVALLCPTWTHLPAANLMLIHSFTVHILLATYPMMLTVGGDIRPHAAQIPRCLLFLLCLAIPIYGFDRLFDTNFMFLLRAPQGTPLVWFAQHWGNHLLGYPILLAAMLAVMYLPWIIARRIRSHRSAALHA